MQYARWGGPCSTTLPTGRSLMRTKYLTLMTKMHWRFTWGKSMPWAQERAASWTRSREWTVLPLERGIKRKTLQLWLAPWHHVQRKVTTKLQEIKGPMKVGPKTHLEIENHQKTWSNDSLDPNTCSFSHDVDCFVSKFIHLTSTFALQTASSPTESDPLWSKSVTSPKGGPTDLLLVQKRDVTNGGPWLT